MLLAEQLNRIKHCCELRQKTDSNILYMFMIEHISNLICMHLQFSNCTIVFDHNGKFGWRFE